MFENRFPGPTRVRIVLSCMLAALVAVAASSAPAKGPAIKKCRDAAGRWHYGDTAAAACANSKVIVLDEHGMPRREIAPPPTEEELRAREAERTELEQARAQAKHDELLLTTYATEADILYIRDRRLAQLEAMIQASTATVQPLRATLERLQKQALEEQKAEGRVSEHTEKSLAQTRAQIAKHEAAIEDRRAEQESVRTQAQQDLERYRALKARGTGTAAR